MPGPYIRLCGGDIVIQCEVTNYFPTMLNNERIKRKNNKENMMILYGRLYKEWGK